MLAALALGCGAAPITTVAAPDEPLPPRRPDGVVLEAPPAIPSAVTRAEARGVVALRQPVSGVQVRELVRALADAWQRGSLDGLRSLLSPEAGPLEARARGPGALVEAFRQRLRAHEYARLEGVELVRLERVQHHAWAELGGPDAPARPPDMRLDEILVRVPLETTQLAGEKLFEAAIVLLVAEEQGHLRVRAYGEVP